MAHSLSNTQDYLQSERLWSIVSKKISESDIIQKTSDIHALFKSLTTEFNNKIKQERTTQNVKNYQKTVLFQCKSEIDKFQSAIKDLEKSVSDVYTKEQLMLERNSKFNRDLERREQEFRDLQPKQPDMINFSETINEHNKDIESLLEAERRRRERDINVLSENIDPTVAKEWIQNSTTQHAMKHNNMVENPVEKLVIPENIKLKTKKQERIESAKRNVSFSLDEEEVKPILPTNSSKTTSSPEVPNFCTRTPLLLVCCS